MNLECKIIIKTMPIKSILSCDQYSLLYQNQKFILNCDKLISGEEISFKLKNFNSSLNRYLAYRIIALENNSANQPQFSRKNKNKVFFTVPEYNKVHDSQIPRLNCLFELVFNDNKISILIDAIIIPIEFNFELYDYYDKDFKNDDSPIYIYASDEILENNKMKVDLIFKMSFLVEGLNIKGELDINNNYNSNSLEILPKEKINFNKKEKKIKYSLTIDSNFSFPLNNNSRKIDSNFSFPLNNNSRKNQCNCNSIYDNKVSYIEFALNVNNKISKIIVKIEEAP